jgi:hypothetical protein
VGGRRLVVERAVRAEIPRLSNRVGRCFVRDVQL